MAALVLGEFSVNSGWFSPEVMLYMAFVAIANYTQANYEIYTNCSIWNLFSTLPAAVSGTVYSSASSN